MPAGKERDLRDAQPFTSSGINLSPDLKGVSSGSSNSGNSNCGNSNSGNSACRSGGAMPEITQPRPR